MTFVRASFLPAVLLLGLSAALPAHQARNIFATEGRVLTGGRVFSIASADLDGDERPDIVVSDFLNPARVLYNDAGLGFTKVAPLTATAETATEGHGVAVADFNGDRRLDLFLVYNGNPSRVLFGDGKGGFTDSGRAIGAPGLNGTSVEAADVDGDGDVDALVSHYQQKDLIYLNDGKGTFTVSDQAFEGNATLGDLDGDGDPDAVCVPGGGAGPASIWLNTNRRFVLQDRTYDVGEGIAFVTLADFDGDRDLDLVVLGRTAKTTLWENDGRGGFRRLEQTLDPGTRMAAGDIDLDGDLDLVVGNAVWLNVGDRRFEKVQTIDLGSLPTALLLVDIDKDGDLDLLANRGSRETGKTELLLFLNTLRRTSSPGAVAAPPPAPSPAGPAAQDPATWRRAEAIVRQYAAIDTHAHDPYKPISPRWPQQVTLPLMVQERLGGLVQAVPLSALPSERPLETILADLRRVKAQIETDDRVMIALTAADFDRGRRLGRPAVMLGLESFYGPLEGRPDTLDTYYREGVRVVGLARGGKDLVTDGEGASATLSPFGREAVAAMNRLGIACDVTHLPDPVRRAVIDASRAPILVSHTAAFSLVPNRSNIDDATVDRVAAADGLIGITFCSEQLSKETFAQRERVQDPTKLPPARVEDLVDHIDYLRKRAGIERVALGSDFGGSGRMAPTGFETVGGLPLVVYHLLKRGYSEREVRQVIGDNFVRFLERVERAASQQ